MTCSDHYGTMGFSPKTMSPRKNKFNNEDLIIKHDQRPRRIQSGGDPDGSLSCHRCGRSTISR